MGENRKTQRGMKSGRVNYRKGVVVNCITWAVSEGGGSK
jgi:hypothetical protein